MSERFSVIGFTSSQVYDNGVFVRVYADVKLLQVQKGNTKLLLFKCTRGYVAFGMDSLSLKKFGYAERTYGNINYTTLPDEDLDYVIQITQKQLTLYKGIEGENTFINTNKSRKPNLLLASTLLL